MCISQRDGLHVVPLPQIDKLIGQGLDLAIQAERGTAMSVSHLSDHYNMFENDGNHEAAEKMRILTKHALQNGDEFFEPRHAEALR